jgi:hypothetical protein
MSGVELRMDPRTPPMTREAFCRNRPAFSIALDGYVHGGPWFSREGPHASFNHHEGVDRLSTRATCAQVLMAIRQGLFDTFREDGLPRALVWADDCDEDVCTAWFLLHHPHLVTHTINPLLNRLVAMEDALDSTAGAYPYPACLPSLGELAWVFEPYRRARASGLVDGRDPAALAGVVEDVAGRIARHIVGGGSQLAPDLRYRTLHQGQGWRLVEELGAQARTALFADGVRAFVAARPRPDGRWTYTVGRMSPFVPFDVPVLLAALDAAEGGEVEHWGGGNTIGGSPRIAGSRLGPEEAARIVGDALDRSRGGTP